MYMLKFINYRDSGRDGYMASDGDIYYVTTRRNAALKFKSRNQVVFLVKQLTHDYEYHMSGENKWRIEKV